MANTNLVELTVSRTALPTQNVEEMISDIVLTDCTNQLGAELITSARNRLAEFEKQAQTEHDKMKRPILDAGKAVDAYWRPIRTRINEGKMAADKKLTTYLQAEQRKRDALEMKAREDARAEQERLAHEAAAREAQAQLEAERLRREAEQLNQNGNSAAAAELTKRAEQAEMAGAQDSQLLIEQIQQTIPLEVPEAYKPDGITTVTTWEGVCEDLQELARACVEGRAPWTLLTHVQPELNRLAGALQGEFRVPGCSARQKTHIRRK